MKYLSLAVIVTALNGTQAYEGSSFNEVLEVIKESQIKSGDSFNVKKEKRVYLQGDLPTYKSFTDESLQEDAKRTLTDIFSVSSTNCKSSTRGNLEIIFKHDKLYF